MRIAMWSGPRNLSTAMMRAFENRPDTVVVDEPFYAAFLARTRIDHPLKAEVLAVGETDPDRVAAGLAGPVPGGAAIFYQKQMTHHLLADFPRGWMDACAHAFLIRRPERVLASYVARRAEVDLADIGFIQQAELFDDIAARTGAVPPVIDAEEVLADPARTLAALCQALAIPFDKAMLAWPAGPRPSDGVWAPAWYEAVWRSTGFAAPSPDLPPLPSRLAHIAAQAQPAYERLARHRL